MESNVLGLQIVRTYKGDAPVFSLNVDHIWTKNIWDIREDLKKIDNGVGHSSILMIASYENGSIIIIASLIEGRTNDYISAWIYVPNALIISGKQLDEIVQETRNEIIAREFNDKKLGELFNLTYNVTPTLSVYNKSITGNIAYRYYGKGSGYERYELLDNLNQSYYFKYKYVILLDKASNQRCSSGDDITDKKISVPILVKKPVIENGFTPYLNDKPFDTPLLIEEGSQITVIWKKRGYYPIYKKQIIQKDYAINVPSFDDYFKSFPMESLDVRNESGQALDKKCFSIRINDSQPDQNGCFKVREDQIANSKIEVEAEGYAHYSQKMSLSGDCSIQLHKEDLKYAFILLLRGYGPYTISVTSKKPINQSPIRGYKVLGRHISECDENRLVYIRISKLSLFLMVCTLVVGFIIGFCIINHFKNDKIETLNNEIETLKVTISQSKYSTTNNSQRASDTPFKDEKTNNPPKKESDNWADIINYLDANPVWERAAMDNYPKINGLWDYINQHKFENILKYEDMLGNSINFKKLLNAVKRNKNKPFSSNYCSDTDTKITIETYIKNLEKSVTSSQNDKKVEKETKSKTTKQDDLKL